MLGKQLYRQSVKASWLWFVPSLIMSVRGVLGSNMNQIPAERAFWPKRCIESSTSSPFVMIRSATSSAIRIRYGSLFSGDTLALRTTLIGYAHPISSNKLFLRSISVTTALKAFLAPSMSVITSVYTNKDFSCKEELGLFRVNNDKFDYIRAIMPNDRQIDHVDTYRFTLILLYLRSEYEEVQ